MNLRRTVKPEKKAFARKMRQEPTRYEAILWRRLRCKRFFGRRWRRQSIIRGYIVDFYCPSLQIAVEVDGSVHDPVKDAIRDKNIYRATKIRVLRFSNEAVQNRIGEVMDYIAVESGVRTFPTNPQEQQQQGIRLRDRGSSDDWRCGNVQRIRKTLPPLDIEEISREKPVSSSWMQREPCFRQVFADPEVAQGTVRVLEKQGISCGRVGTCRVCGKIHVEIEKLLDSILANTLVCEPAPQSKTGGVPIGEKAGRSSTEEGAKENGQEGYRSPGRRGHQVDRIKAGTVIRPEARQDHSPARNGRCGDRGARGRSA